MSRQLGFGLPESHLLPDAIVAFVDNEMSTAATERAAEHVAHCPWCAADVQAQRQVRSAVQDAREPSMSAGFLASLRSIPQDTEVDATPDNLAVTEDGQLVAVQRPGRIAGLRSRGLGTATPVGGTAPLGGGPAPLGSSTPLGQSGNALGGDASLGDASLGRDPNHGGDAGEGGGNHGKRRAAQGAGVVVSGLVLSALALVGTSAGPVGDQNRSRGGEQPNTNVLRAQFGGERGTSTTGASSVSTSRASTSQQLRTSAPVPANSGPVAQTTTSAAVPAPRVTGAQGPAPEVAKTPASEVAKSGPAPEVAETSVPEVAERH